MKKYITYDKYNKTINRLNLISRNGLELIIKPNYIKIVLGCSIIGISLITPFTNVFLIPLGLFIIGITIRDLEEFKRKVKNKFKQLHKKRGSE